MEETTYFGITILFKYFANHWCSVSADHKIIKTHKINVYVIVGMNEWIWLYICILFTYRLPSVGTPMAEGLVCLIDPVGHADGRFVLPVGSP